MGEANYTIMEGDLVAANRLHARQLWNQRAILKGWLIGTMALTLVGFWLCPSVDWRILWAPVIATAYMIFGALFSFVVFSYFARRHYRQAHSFWIPTKLEWDRKAVRFTSDRGEVRFDWSDFFSWAADGRSILLYQSGNLFITVPVRALKSEAVSEIVSILKDAGVPVRSSR